MRGWVGLALVLGCGGTTLDARDGKITNEVVWHSTGEATGGGVSQVFGRPRYQSGHGIPLSPLHQRRGRGVPDVAAVADRDTGIRLRLADGRQWVGGGTSSTAPLWAAFMVLANQALVRQNKPRAGFVNPRLYDVSIRNAVFRDIVTGNNDVEGLGVYDAGPGWDACTGLGSPDLTELIKALG